MIEWIGITDLLEHPANPNRMPDRLLKRLERHIDRTGRYEPLVVRPHPSRAGCYQVLNGHHRLKVLRCLGYERVACVVWQVDDGEALVLLATLNRLSGRDDLEKKGGLIASLSQRFEMADLASMLPDSRAALGRLRDLGGRQSPAPDESAAEPFLHALVFFVTSEEKRIVEEALRAAAQTMGGTPGRRKARVLVAWAQNHSASGGEVTKLDGGIST